MSVCISVYSNSSKPLTKQILFCAYNQGEVREKLHFLIGAVSSTARSMIIAQYREPMTVNFYILVEFFNLQTYRQIAKCREKLLGC